MIKTIAHQLLSILKTKGKFLIIIKGSPDPDALASAYMLHSLICHVDNKADIISFMEISLPQNRVLIKKIKIPLQITNDIDFDSYTGYIVLDHQSAWVEEIGNKIPCLIHIDHHSPEEDKIEPVLKYISEEAGAVSTILSLMLRDTFVPLFPELSLTKIATALLYGIKIDTDNFKIRTPLDIEACTWLNSFADQTVIDEIENMPYSEETMTIITKAIMNSYRYKDFLFCGVGFLSEEYRDSIAITADYLLTTESSFAVIVFACIEKKKSGLYLDASVRTAERNYDLNQFIKKITNDGGARSYKGAFQVNLDFFSTCPDKPGLWEIIQKTTHHQLSAARDAFPPHSLKNVFSRMKQKLKGIFKIHK